MAVKLVIEPIFEADFHDCSFGFRPNRGAQDAAERIAEKAKVKSGPVTTLGVTQTGDGKMKFIVSEAEATDDPIMAIGNTQTHVRLATDPDTWYERWLMEAPTHHFAMSVGHNAALFRKVADLMGIACVII